jgi:hypothetical protein
VLGLVDEYGGLSFPDSTLKLSEDPHAPGSGPMFKYRKGVDQHHNGKLEHGSSYLASVGCQVTIVDVFAHSKRVGQQGEDCSVADSCGLGCWPNTTHNSDPASALCVGIVRGPICDVRLAPARNKPMSTMLEYSTKDSPMCGRH